MMWETIIGLEVHVELNTKAKLFSPAANHFGDEPNSNISPICTGEPGALPMVNREAVKKAIQFGLAIGAEINLASSFDRKSYFYPDSPRNFQITQFYQPIIRGGSIKARIGQDIKEFAIRSAHLEDDSGTLKHFSNFTGVDYNRAGVPLIEIVSEPCLRTGKEASAYAQAMKAILEYLNVSDCNMEEGSLRFDVNVSVRLPGEAMRTKVEIKNMNSFAFMEKAIEVESRRQIEAYMAGKKVDHSTFRFDPEKKETVLMRSKESAEDYRYFPEPDLPPLIISREFVEELGRQLPELPLDKWQRYSIELALHEESASVLVSSLPLALYFEEALKHCGCAKALANWIIVEFGGRFKETGRNLLTSGILPEHVASLVSLIENETITGKIAKLLADEMVLTPGVDPKSLVKENPKFQPLTNEKEIASLIDAVLKENPQSIADFKAGRDRAFGFLVGQVMKLCQGKASPSLVNELLKKAISCSSNGGK